MRFGLRKGPPAKLAALGLRQQAWGGSGADESGKPKTGARAADGAAAGAALRAFRHV